MLKRIDHVQITVTPAAEGNSVRFYRDVLGLREIPKPEPLRARGGAWFDCNGVQVHIGIEEAAGGNDRSKRHLCFLVDDADHARRTFEAAGATIIPDEQPVEGWSRFYVRDPGGNRIEIAQKIS
jgi:catechol 2,3-dioxygenase-like lactoylglutathione lyase family enzyme